MTQPRTTGAATEARAAFESAKEGAADSLRDVKDRAQEGVHEAKERARSYFAEQKDAAASRLGGLAEVLRNSARDLDERGGASAGLADGAAERLERVAGSLRERDLDGLLDEVERFARRRPALFVGGAVAAGFLFIRFSKSSSERRRGIREEHSV